MGCETVMFSEVNSVNDLRYVHFVVILFRQNSDKLKQFGIYLKNLKLSTNKQYWALVTKVCKKDTIHSEDSFYVTFVNDNNEVINLWIPCELCGKDITVYIFRTPDEELSLEMNKVRDEDKICKNCKFYCHKDELCKYREMEMSTEDSKICRCGYFEMKDIRKEK